MTSLKIKNIEIGKGIPKICVPLVGRSRAEVLEEIIALEGKLYDIVEWRADYFGDSFNVDEILSFLAEISEMLKKKAILFTFRTDGEGGSKSVSAAEYYLLNERVIQAGRADMVDIELLIGDDIVKKLVYIANKNSIPILMSNHDFEKTPPKEILIKRLCRMQQLGADITKIAVMPVTIKDVVTVIDVMAEMEECYADKPVVAVSMSGSGVITRIAGEIFGSAITFGSLKAPSAPGQLDVEDLALIQKIIHKAYRC